ncbi:10135_t:CDS:2, partial [Ambispora leptoticha]
EQRYIWLSLTTNRCEFCHSKDSSAQIYWVFRVRCCTRCLVEKTISQQKLLKEGKISKTIMSCLPYIHPCGYRLYWHADILKAQQEFDNLAPKEIASWVLKKHQIAYKITHDAKIREHAYNHQQYQNGVNIGHQIDHDNCTRRAGMMLKELGQELLCDTTNLQKSSTYREWEKVFDPHWEEIMWEKWRVAMKKECIKTNNLKKGLNIKDKKYLIFGRINVMSSQQGSLGRKSFATAPSSSRNTMRDRGSTSRGGSGRKPVRYRA